LSQLDTIDYPKKHQGYQYLIVLLMFIVGLLNANPYFIYMGLDILNQIIIALFYILLSLLVGITILNHLYKKKKYLFSMFPYWLVLTLAVLIKIFILFIQFPHLFLPGNSYFSLVVEYTSRFLLIFILVTNIHSQSYVRKTIWAFGLGISISVILPFIFYPEMIGTRTAFIEDYYFNGAFWNSSVVAFMTVGWLLVALSNIETLKHKKSILLGLFILFIFGSFAGLSRAAAVSLILSLIVYLIASNQFSRYLRGIIITILISLSVVFFFGDYVDSFMQRFDQGITFENESRTTIWREYIKNIPDYLLFGEIEGDYKKYSYTGHGPHSVFLNWLVQFGIFALIGFVVMIAGVLFSIKNISKYESRLVSAGLYAWLIAYLSIAMINETGFNELQLFASFGIILAWGNQVKKDKKIFINNID